MSVNPTKSITNISSLANRELYNAQQKNQASPAKASVNSSASTNVSLSPAASNLLSLQDNDIDMSKVDKIKQAIASGSLVIDTNKIADELIKQTAQDLEH